MRISSSAVALASLSMLASALACGGARPSEPANDPQAAAPPKAAAAETAPPVNATPVASAPRTEAPESDAGSPAAADDAPAPADAPPPATDAEQKADTHAANELTLKLLAKTKRSGNVMVSGTSLRQAFGAAYVGAGGVTAKEIAAAMGFSPDPKRAASAARAEVTAWQKARGKGAELTVANKIWVDEAMPLKPGYAALVAWAFGAPAENVAFQKKPDEVRRTINGWVADRTREKIKELLPEGAISTDTRAVITNAVYFKGKWFNPFPKDATKDQTFQLEGQKAVSVATMRVTEQFRYAKSGGVTLVELRYVGNDLSMLVVLPDGGLDSLGAAISAAQIERWTASLETARLDLSMPKLTFRSGGSMKSALQAIGMKTVFTERADLSGIAMHPGALHVSDVFHQTWISVDEAGTEAAAATGVAMKLTSLSTGTPTEVKIDRPFLFFVLGQGRILFAGRVLDPRAK